MNDNQQPQRQTQSAQPGFAPLTGSAVFDARLGVPEHLAGVFAEDQLKAEGILEFACPTKGADGKWYRCTLATTNVPVAELYNILTNINMVAQRLREVGGPPVEYLVRELEEIHKHIKARDCRVPMAAEDGQCAHANRQNAPGELPGAELK